MTTRVQVLRSSTTGSVPAPGTRQPGEMFVNFADFQLGVIDASRNAQKLIGVRYFQITANYAVGDFVIQGGVLYAAKVSITAGVFNAAQWTQVAAATDPGGPYLPLTGGVLSGPLTIGVASASVDALIITPGAAAGLPARLDASTAGSGVQLSGSWTALNSGGVAVLTAQGNGSIIGIGQGVPNFLAFQNNGGGAVLEVMDQTAAAAGVGVAVRVLNAPTGNPATAVIQTSGVSANRSIQLVPAGAGTIQAPTMAAADSSTAVATTAFVHSALAGPNDNRLINGNFAVNQRGQVSGTALAAAAYGHDRWKAGASGCTYTFTVALPDTTITITAGALTQIIEAGVIEGGVYTLSWTGTAQARVYQGTPTGSYAASPLSTASLAAGANTTVEFNVGTVTRVKLEIGSVATSYNRYSLAKSMADCQRYYQKIGGAVAQDLFIQGFLNSAAPFTTILSYPQMRSAPTIVQIGTFTMNNIGSVSFVPGLQTMAIQLNSSAAGNVVWYNPNTSVYLTASAELLPMAEEYQLTAHPNTIIRVSDQAFIPTDPDNIDYQDYLAWLDAGNTPTPTTPPPAPEG